MEPFVWEIVISVCRPGVSQQGYETQSFCLLLSVGWRTENVEKWRRARVACLLRVFGQHHCHSNVLLRELNWRGECKMSTNGEQREKWNNWIWLRLSVSTGQDVISSWKWLRQWLRTRMTLCEVVLWRTYGMRNVKKKQKKHVTAHFMCLRKKLCCRLSLNILLIINQEFYFSFALFSHQMLKYALEYLWRRRTRWG